MIDLSIVIPSYEAADCLAACLASIDAAQKAHPALAIEVIVVDNGSRDGSLAVAQRAAQPLRLVAWLENRGFAAAANAGLRRRRGRHALILNSDVEIDPDLLQGAVHRLDEDPSIGVLGPSLRHPDGRPQRSVHAEPDLATELVPEWMLRRLRPSGFESQRAEGTTGGAGRDVEAVRGAVFFMGGEAIDRLGCFDEGFFFFLEETEYCSRVRRAGRRVVYAGDLRARHRLGASSKRRAPLVTRIEFHRSLYRFLRQRRGRTTEILARVARVLRNLPVVAGLSFIAPFSKRVRARWVERAGLVLWHLRACPPVPTLATLAERGELAEMPR